MSDTTGPRPLKRVATGIEGLDTVLNGGFLETGIYIIRGTPGSGKTILGNQLAFKHVSSGNAALYVTLLAESHAHMMQHLGVLRYFDTTKISRSLNYISAFRELEEEGLKGLITIIRREITRHKATLVVIDGLVAAGERSLSATEFKKFIHELQTVASLSGSTMFLLTSSMDTPVTPEQTMVDGIVDLRDNLRGARATRTLEVSKFRGSAALRGLHSFRITDSGIVVFPRIESLLRTPSGEAVWLENRIATGITDLDKSLNGGIPCGTTTVVLGSSGTGKTSLGLQFLNAGGSDAGLFFGFYEPTARLIGKAGSLGFDMDRKVKDGQIEVVWNPTTETLIDELGHQLLIAVRRQRTKRLVIDGLGGFQVPAGQQGRIAAFFSAVANELRVMQVTTLITIEARNFIGPEIPLPENISSVAENMMLLRTAEIRGAVRRILAIVKMRDSNYDPRVREFLIGSDGISLGQGFDQTDALLTGSSRAEPAS